MRKKQFGITLAGICLGLLLCSCGKQESKKEESQKQAEQAGNQSEYISFTVTKEEGYKLQMYTYTYDLEKEEISQKGETEYTAQYPLTVYDELNDYIYYSQRDETDCDQLARKNLTTGEEEVLTDSLFAINYIIPINENVYVAAVQKGERAVGLYSYAKGKLKRVLENPDAFVWKINVNPVANQVVFNTYSQSELDKNMESDEGDEGTGTNTIWILDMQDGKIAKIAEVESGDMINIGIKEDGEIYYNLAELRKLEDGKTEVCHEFDGLNLKEFIYLNGDQIYYIDWDDNIVKYDKTQDKKEIIFTVEEDLAALNNAIVLSGE